MTYLRIERKRLRDFIQNQHEIVCVCECREHTSKDENRRSDGSNCEPFKCRLTFIARLPLPINLVGNEARTSNP